MYESDLTCTCYFRFLLAQSLCSACRECYTVKQLPLTAVHKGRTWIKQILWNTAHPLERGMQEQGGFRHPNSSRLLWKQTQGREFSVHKNNTLKSLGKGQHAQKTPWNILKWENSGLQTGSKRWINPNKGGPAACAKSYNPGSWEKQLTERWVWVVKSN